MNGGAGRCGQAIWTTTTGNWFASGSKMEEAARIRLLGRLHCVPRCSRESAIVDTVAHLTIGVVERFAMRELSDEEMQRVNKHIASCRDCYDWLQVEIAQTAAMRSWRARARKILKATNKKTAKG